MKTTGLSIFPSLTIFLTSLTLLFATAAQAQVPSYVPTNGLVGWWPFNGNANDESGNGNDGTVNGATLTADRFGDASKAYSFDGNNNNILVPHSNSFNFQANNRFSVSCWLNTQNLNNLNCIVIEKQQSLGNSQLGWNVGIETNSMFNLYLHNGVGGLYSTNYGLVNINEWSNLLYTWDNGVSNVYLNGQLIGTANINDQVGDNSESLIIGNNDFGVFGFNGFIDDIGMWNRALTADEVLALYNGCNVAPLAVSGNVTPTQFTQETYTYPNTAGSTYNWTVTNGVIVSGQGTNSIDVMWANTGIGSVSVVETNATTCTGDVVTYDVVVIPTNVEELSNAMILYPNPATTELNLQITSDLIGTDFFVFDALGKQILKQQILSTNTIINTSSFATGNYVVKVGGGVKKFEVVK